LEINLWPFVHDPGQSTVDHQVRGDHEVAVKYRADHDWQIMIGGRWG